LPQSVLAWASPYLPPVTLAASLVRYECDSGKRDFKSKHKPFIPSINYKKFISEYLSAKLLKTNSNLS